MAQAIDIRNRQASHEFAFVERYVAGIVLKGSEVKSIREGKAIIGDAHCLFSGNELFVKGIHISEYKNAGSFGHLPVADRKLLLSRKELNNLREALKNRGLTIVPLRMFINDKGFVKLEIALAKGKKTHDKREDIRKRDVEREIRRKFK